MEIEYRKNSCCGEVSDEELDETLDFLTEAGLVVDQEYIKHIRNYNGGIPILRFFPGGEIERFLNFTDSYKPDCRRFQDFNVNVVRSWIKNRVPPNIIPFASLPHGAFLCFNHSTRAIPSVVIWNSEATAEEFAHVADSFKEFAGLLRNEPY